MRDILSWPTIVAAWHMSRLWSMVHTFYNNGVPAFWYIGHDVYKMNDLGAWTVAYVAEGACFMTAIGCRLFWDRLDKSSEDCSAHEEKFIPSKEFESKPILIHSESAVSTSSMM